MKSTRIIMGRDGTIAESETPKQASSNGAEVARMAKMDVMICTCSTRTPAKMKNTDPQRRKVGGEGGNGGVMEQWPIIGRRMTVVAGAHLPPPPLRSFFLTRPRSSTIGKADTTQYRVVVLDRVCGGLAAWGPYCSVCPRPGF